MIGEETITISPCGGTGKHTTWMSVEGDAELDYRNPFTLRVCFCKHTEELLLNQPFGSRLRMMGLSIVPAENWNAHHRWAFVSGTMSNVREIVPGHIWLVDVKAHVAPDVLPGKTGKWRLAFRLGDGSGKGLYAASFYGDMGGPLQQSPGKQLAREVRLSDDTLTIDEGGTAAYTVVLGSRPTTDVTVRICGDSDTDLICGDSDTDLTLSPRELNFTPDTWDVPQTVIVSAAEDGDTAINAAVELTHMANGGNYTSHTIATTKYGYKPHLAAYGPHLEPIEEPSLMVNITERAQGDETASEGSVQQSGQRRAHH